MAAAAILKNYSGIARFPCDSTGFLFSLQMYYFVQHIACVATFGTIILTVKNEL